MEENIMAEQPVSTPDTTQEIVEQPVETPAPQPQASVPEKTYTKSEIMNLMKKRVERSHKAFFKRYGVNDIKEMDEVFGYKDKYLSLQNKNAELVREIAFMKNNISPERYEDIITYFKGKGLDFSEDELITQLATHPEWMKQETLQQPVVSTTTIRKLGSEAHATPKESEKDIASKLLGVKL